jgi:hypothetical protein
MVISHQLEHAKAPLWIHVHQHDGNIEKAPNLTVSGQALQLLIAELPVVGDGIPFVCCLTITNVLFGRAPAAGAYDSIKLIHGKFVGDSVQEGTKVVVLLFHDPIQQLLKSVRPLRFPLFYRAHSESLADDKLMHAVFTTKLADNRYNLECSASTLSGAMTVI